MRLLKWLGAVECDSLHSGTVPCELIVVLHVLDDYVPSERRDLSPVPVPVHGSDSRVRAHSGGLRFQWCRRNRGYDDEWVGIQSRCSHRQEYQCLVL